MTQLRIGALQFGVTKSIEKNVLEIKKGIDWAKENECNYIITPEVALSGYEVSEFNVHTCHEVENAVKNVIAYSSQKKIGIMLGTLWLEDKDTRNDKGMLGKKYNQIRIYNTDGNLIEAVSKTHTVSYDMDCIPGTKTPVVEISHLGATYKIGILICNDLAGNYWNGGDNIPKQISENQADIIVHASNSAKDFMNKNEKDIHDNFHLSTTKFMSYATNIPFMSVDNIYNINGVDINSETSYPSGVYLPLETKYQSPRNKVDYFYYDVEKQN